ncbi:MAG TPA: hypothetical protein VNT75_20700 [Symbiobacteriaceae bacterium]|nr:hypothetical protein [Symbiobacteriaceae bacterium]
MREEMLDGGSRRIDLGSGYSLISPGLKGKAILHEKRTAGTRGPESATDTLDGALAAAGIKEVRTIELQVQPVPVPPGSAPVRSASGEDALVLEVPDLGPDVGQVVMAVDEAGVVTYSFPESAGTAKRFRVRRRVAPRPSEGTKRGLIGTLGKKFLKVLVYPLTDPILGPIGEQYAAKWEAEHRPYGIRWFTPDDYVQPAGRPVTAADWTALAQGPVLLWVHGTFSTAHDGFGSLPQETMQQFWVRYGGRVIAFNHPSLSQDPRENAAWFVSQIPAGIRLDLDIVCHSRGGLVSRMLAEYPALNVRRIVFVGTPNRGTKLADPNHMVDMLDRLTTVVNLIPIKSAQAVLESILAALKVVGHGALKGLPGLASMDPTGQFQHRVAGGPPSHAVYYGITADYEPTEPGLKEFVMNEGADRIFGEANDLVVPTEGVYKPSQPGFPIPAERLLTFGHADGVTHVTYFQTPGTGARLLDWLTPEQVSLAEVAAGQDPAGATQ